MILDEDLKNSTDYSEGQKEAAHRTARLLTWTARCRPAFCLSRDSPRISRDFTPSTPDFGR